MTARGGGIDARELHAALEHARHETDTDLREALAAATSEIKREVRWLIVMSIAVGQILSSVTWPTPLTVGSAAVAAGAIAWKIAATLAVR